MSRRGDLNKKTRVFLVAEDVCDGFFCCFYHLELCEYKRQTAISDFYTFDMATKEFLFFFRKQCTSRRSY
jgi:hypothetical protein